MRYLIAAFWLLFWGVAYAQQPGVNPPNGVVCNGIGSLGPVTLCKPGWSYGCQANQQSTAILAIDGQRTGIQFQNTGTTPITLTFGDSAVSGVNGFLVQPGNSYLWSNIGRGNEPGRVTTGAVSIITTAGALNSCTFLFTD